MKKHLIPFTAGVVKLSGKLITHYRNPFMGQSEPCLLIYFSSRNPKKSYRTYWGTTTCA